MTTTLTKAELASKLAAAGKPLTQSQVKNATIAHLTAMVDAMHVDNVHMPDAETPTTNNVPAPKAAKATKARAPFMRKPGREAKTVKAGTRRAAIMQAFAPVLMREIALSVNVIFWAMVSSRFQEISRTQYDLD